MFGIDTPFDLWRLLNLVVGVFCIVWLFGGLAQQHKQWNTKTRDFWYSRLMWAFTQVSLSVDGIVQHIGISFSLPLITAAGLVTMKALAAKGSWGFQDNKK